MVFVHKTQESFFIALFKKAWYNSLKVIGI